MVVGELGEGPGAAGVLAGAGGDLGDLAVGAEHGRALDGGGLAGAGLDDSEGDGALAAVGDAGGSEVRDVEDGVGNGHRGGGESEEGANGELHLDGWVGCLVWLVRLKRVSWLLE